MGVGTMMWEKNNLIQPGETLGIKSDQINLG